MIRLVKKLFAWLQSGLKANLLAGLLFLMPVAATFYFLYFLVTVVDKTFLLLPMSLRPESFLPFPVPGLGLILVFMVLLLTGLFVRNFFGRKLVELGEWIMSYIPFVSKVYKAVKQLVTTIFSTTSREFKRVVLIEYPRKGVYALAYVTGTAVGEIQEKTACKVLNVFLPTTPNPTSGFYLMVPEKDVIPLEMSVEDSFKVLMSGGILNPDAKL